MRTVMKIQLNYRISSDFNSSVSFEHIVSSEDEAKEMGQHDKRLHEAYMNGFGEE